MRIRNRKIPIPLSSLSPVPLSDPYWSSPIINGVQLGLHRDNPYQYHSRQASKATCFGSQIRGRGCSDGPVALDEEMEKREMTKYCMVELEKNCGWEDREMGADNDASKGGSLGTELNGKMVHQESITSHEGVGRRYGGERVFPIPLKKRRGSFESKNVNEALIEKDKKLKTKMNKKYVQQIGNCGEENVDKDNYKQIFCCNSSNGSDTSARKRSRGIDAVLVKGSRCSRVNGRGWRCCQQTLVGYSLCEHHLGKGRLRSLTSGRSRSALKKADSRPLSMSSLLSEEKEAKHLFTSNNKVGGEEEDGKKPWLTVKKKTKLGKVKARSISSLLGQQSNAIAVADEQQRLLRCA